jgi:hypothetical protein
MSVRSAIGLGLAIGLAVLGCGGEDSASSSSGLNEPIRVLRAQYREGPLPGRPLDDEDDSGPAVTVPVLLQRAVFYQGESNLRATGHVSPDAVSVGISLPEFSDGHWVLPVGGIEQSMSPTDPQWVTRLEISPEAPTGLHRLLSTAFDPSGATGRQRQSREICILPRIPDNRRACFPDNPLPDTVVVLTWDTNVDLDLVVVTPSGRRVTARHPSVTDPASWECPTDPSDPDAEPELGPHCPQPDDNPRIERDSLLDCVPDGMRQEHIVFMNPPDPGRWTFFARLFNGCGIATVRYALSIHRPDADGEALEEIGRWPGQLIAAYHTEPELGANGERVLEYEFD